MSKRDWKLYCEDIIESIQHIENYIKDLNLDGFKKDRKTIDAVVRNFTIIGEASKNIPNDIKQKFSEIDWRGIAGFRNRIIHEYFELSLDVMWVIITKELPVLKNQTKQIVNS
jgi:uncharacterized protein with HEPN domain